MVLTKVAKMPRRDYQENCKPKFQVGDTVIISSNIRPYFDDVGSVGWNSDMTKEAGKQTKVVEVVKSDNVKSDNPKKVKDVYIYLCDNHFWWNENWLEKPNSELTIFLNNIESQK